MNSLKEFDNLFKREFKTDMIAGIDEVGRGCIAGPLVVCGLILKPDFYHPEIKDSKKIKSREKMNFLSDLILKNTISLIINVYSSKLIDQDKNIKASTINIMKEIAIDLPTKVILVDGEKISIDNKITKQIIKGDDKSFVIACASIVAKSYRDNLMEDASKLYPLFNWVENKGYGTIFHYSKLNLDTITIFHRKTYNLKI